jgi:hypothetical protein
VTGIAQTGEKSRASLKLGKMGEVQKPDWNCANWRKVKDLTEIGQNGENAKT